MFEFETESVAMRLFRRFGFDSVAWALRRLHCPVADDALVLEVGSGGNPYYRSNVLLDAYETTRQRHWVPLVADRPMALGFVERLPFRDKSFDFVIASHVLEHSSHPEQFLEELQRVARAGYIEVPDAFMERLNPYRDHRLEITVRDGALVVHKKSSWIDDPYLVELYEQRAKKIVTRETIPHHPFDFHIRYYWKDEICFVVKNPETVATWQAPELDGRAGSGGGFRQRLNGLALESARRLLSQRKRNRGIRLLDVLHCPTCREECLSIVKEEVVCGSCSQRYPIRNGIPCLFPPDNFMKML